MKPVCLVVTSLLMCALLIGCDNTETGPSVTTTSFSSIDLRLGTGAVATTGSMATVSYTGWLFSPAASENKGAQFDMGSFTFAVGTTDLIPGFSNGIAGMKTGGARRMIIPPQLAFGADGAPPTIPPNATLIFDVELLAVE